MSEKDEAHNASDVKRFNEIARQTQLFEELQTAIGTFLASFATFESAALNAALSALSTDSTVIEFLPELMDLSNRLKLLKYVAIAKKLPEALQEDIAAVRSVANALRDCRNDIAHGTALLYGTFLTNPTSGDFVAGVQRPRSKRVIPREPLSPEGALDLHRQWVHHVPTILKWAEIAGQLQRATLQLAIKLQHHQLGQRWEHIRLPAVEMPERDKKTPLAT